jgi:ubiquinone/menaquinone biosynthesis C-methylase UbiE
MTNSRNVWDNVASYYDAVWEVPDYSPILKAINRETKVSSAGTVLDVATGTGIVALDLAKRTVHKGEIIGLDASRPMLKKALEKANATAFHNVQFILGDAHILPFRDNCLDAVTCCFCLSWFSYPTITIREMMRVVKPMKKVVCVEYEKPPVEFWAELRRKAGIKDFDKSELITILINSGLKKVKAGAISVLHKRPNVSDQLVKRSDLYTLTIMGLKKKDAEWFFPRVREEYGKLSPDKKHWLPFLYQGTK